MVAGKSFASGRLSGSEHRNVMLVVIRQRRISGIDSHDPHRARAAGPVPDGWRVEIPAGAVDAVECASRPESQNRDAPVVSGSIAIDAAKPGARVPSKKNLRRGRIPGARRSRRRPPRAMEHRRLEQSPERDSGRRRDRRPRGPGRHRDGTTVRPARGGARPHGARLHRRETAERRNAASRRHVLGIAGRDDRTGAIVLKVVNTGPQPASMSIDVTGGTAPATGRATVLTSENPIDENSFESPCKIVPATSTLSGVGRTFTHVFPAYSLSIVRMK